MTNAGRVERFRQLLAPLATLILALRRPIGLCDSTNAFVSGSRTLLAGVPATSRLLETGD